MNCKLDCNLFMCLFPDLFCLFGQFCNESHVSVLEMRGVSTTGLFCLFCLRTLLLVLVLEFEHRVYSSPRASARGVHGGKNGQLGQFWHYD